MDFEQRSRATRDRAEEALIRFALLVGDHWRDFVVIGGLNPDFLAPAAPAPHVGTTDVDLLFELGFVYDRDDLDFGWLDAALQHGGFIARSGVAGWQWDAVLGDVRVRLDLLCDVPDSPGQTVALPGAREAAVQNLRGPAAALQNTVSRTLRVPPRVRAEGGDIPADVQLRFAGLGGYLAAKSAALLGRGMSKDAYDLVFVTLYNPGEIDGAVEAVRALSPGVERPPIEVVRDAMRLIADDSSVSAGHFASQMRDAGDDESYETLLNDARSGARRFLRDLDAEERGR